MVAEAAGVHPSTASRALDPAKRHLIAADVVTLIEATARKVGYRRNLGAAALRTGRSRLIGVLLPDIANPVFGPILGGVEEALAAEGYSAIVANAGGSAERAAAAAEQLIARRVDGLVAATAERIDPVVSLCLGERVPVVLVNRAEERARAPTVISDDRQGMRLAVDHLVALGHRRIAHLAGPQHVSTGLWRLEGFRASMAEHGLPSDAVATAWAYHREAGHAATCQLIATHRITAIAAANDLLALGAYAALSEAGLRCPDDVSVIGCNDMPLVDLVEPALSTVRINPEELGRRAGRRILRALAQESAAPEIDVVAPVLIIRKSTLPIRRD
ncbi:MAG: LacI family DNA-binding transcriptional regulator [Beijerinckiaceae bacterium]